MKRRLSVLLAMAVAVSAIAVGCGSNEQAATEAPATEAPAAEAAAEEAAPAVGGLKTGLGINTKVSGSEDGLVEAYATIAAVTVDAEGKIVECTIDAAQTKISFDESGKLTSDVSAVYESKNDLGEAYGMKSASGIGKEWNEQAQAFADFCVGKTADEVKGFALTEDGRAADTDLAAGCTVHIGDFQAVVSKAVANATEMGAQAGDKLGLGVTTNIAKSVDASADADGLAQAYTTVCVTTVAADGTITSAIIDAVQANVNFDTAGKITSDITVPVSTKNELGDEYGMKKASAIGKEWNEQAAAYAAYATGKTADEVKATPSEAGLATDADLAASVTVHITDFNTVIEKAVNNAK